MRYIEFKFYDFDGCVREIVRFEGATDLAACVRRKVARYHIRKWDHYDVEVR